MHRFIMNAGLSLFFIFAIAGCAPKAYKSAVTTASQLESQRDYEAAYQYYKQALNTSPNDAHARQKINDLGRTIANARAELAVQALENKKYKTALDILDKALSYDENNVKVNDYRLEATKRYEKIQKKYAQVGVFKESNEWIEAVQTLRDISESYNDDPGLGSQIESVQGEGYHYYMTAGHEARGNGRYSQSLSYFESAESIKPSFESQQEINSAKKYVDADALYMRSQQMLDEKSVLDAMELLIQAKDLGVDHEKVNEAVINLTPEWSPKIFDNGKMFKDSGQFEKTYEAFSMLKVVNPEYPEAQKYFEEAKSLYMEQNYKSLLDAQDTKDFVRINDLSRKLLDIDPDFLDTAEIIARAALQTFNIFYQQGLSYMKMGNFGKAILCFRSAEQQLAETALTREAIQESWDQIRENSSLRMIFLDFSEKIGDLSVSRYITEKIKKRIEAGGGERRFKNITIASGVTQTYDMMTRTRFSSDIEWGSVLSEGFNAVITGQIKMLKQDTSVNSEWKTRKRIVRKIVDNEEYTRLTIRQAELRYGMKSKYWRKENRLSSGQIEDQLEMISEQLLTIPPKIEADVEDEIPYQLVKHTMTAYMQIDVVTLAPDGGHIWPLKHYEDTFQIQDSIIPPNLTSDDPKERMGDPLTLPSESAFKEQAIDYIVEKRIIPDLVKNFQSYGVNFYKKATELSRSKDDSTSDATSFLDSIEEYYKFLACYQVGSEEDTLQEEVEKELDSYVSDLWLIRKKRN